MRFQKPALSGKTPGNALKTVLPVHRDDRACWNIKAINPHSTIGACVAAVRLKIGACKGECGRRVSG
jgi:hypothetical protein